MEKIRKKMGDFESFPERYRIVPELKENGITKKLLVKNKSRFSKVLHNYYREANIQEGFDKFLQKVLKRLD